MSFSEDIIATIEINARDNASGAFRAVSTEAGNTSARVESFSAQMEADAASFAAAIDSSMASSVNAFRSLAAEAEKSATQVDMAAAQVKATYSAMQSTMADSFSKTFSIHTSGLSEAATATRNLGTEATSAASVASSAFGRVGQDVKSVDDTIKRTTEDVKGMQRAIAAIETTQINGGMGKVVDSASGLSSVLGTAKGHVKEMGTHLDSAAAKMAAVANTSVTASIPEGFARTIVEGATAATKKLGEMSVAYDYLSSRGELAATNLGSAHDRVNAHISNMSKMLKTAGTDYDELAAKAEAATARMDKAAASEAARIQAIYDKKKEQKSSLSPEMLGPLGIGGMVVGAGSLATLGLGIWQDMGYTKAETLIKAFTNADPRFAKQIDQQMLTEAPKYGVTPTAGMQSLYSILSAGPGPGASSELLKQSLMAAGASQTDPTQITGAGTQTFMAYGANLMKSSDQVKFARNEMDALNASVNLGTMDWTGLSSALPAVTTQAARMGVTVNELGALFADFTNHGISAQQTGQDLANTLEHIEHPGTAAVKAMRSLGLETSKYFDMAKNGYVPTMEAWGKLLTGLQSGQIKIPSVDQIMSRDMVSYKAAERLHRTYVADPQSLAVAAMGGDVVGLRMMETIFSKQDPTGSYLFGPQGLNTQLAPAGQQGSLVGRLGVQASFTKAENSPDIQFHKALGELSSAAIVLGAQVMPEFVNLLHTVTGIATNFASFAQHNGAVVDTALKVGLIIGGLGAVAFALKFALEPLTGLVKSLSGLPEVLRRGFTGQMSPQDQGMKNILKIGALKEEQNKKEQEWLNAQYAKQVDITSQIQKQLDLTIEQAKIGGTYKGTPESIITKQTGLKPGEVATDATSAAKAAQAPANFAENNPLMAGAAAATGLTEAEALSLRENGGKAFDGLTKRRLTFTVPKNPLKLLHPGGGLNLTENAANLLSAAGPLTGTMNSEATVAEEIKKNPSLMSRLMGSQKLMRGSSMAAGGLIGTTLAMNAGMDPGSAMMVGGMGGTVAMDMGLAMLPAEAMPPVAIATVAAGLTLLGKHLYDTNKAFKDFIQNLPGVGNATKTASSPLDFLSRVGHNFDSTGLAGHAAVAFFAPLAVPLLLTRDAIVALKETITKQHHATAHHHSSQFTGKQIKDLHKEVVGQHHAEVARENDAKALRNQMTGNTKRVIDYYQQDEVSASHQADYYNRRGQSGAAREFYRRAARDSHQVDLLDPLLGRYDKEQASGIARAQLAFEKGLSRDEQAIGMHTIAADAAHKKLQSLATEYSKAQQGAMTADRVQIADLLKQDHGKPSKTDAQIIKDLRADMDRVKNGSVSLNDGSRLLPPLASIDAQMKNQVSYSKAMADSLGKLALKEAGFKADGKPLPVNIVAMAEGNSYTAPPMAIGRWRAPGQSGPDPTGSFLSGMGSNIGLFNDMGAIGHGVESALASAFKAAGNAIGPIISDLKAGIVKYFRDIPTGILHVLELTPVLGPFIQLADALIGHSIVPDMCKAIVAEMKTLPGRILGAVTAIPGELAGVFSRAASSVESDVTKLAATVIADFSSMAARATGEVASWSASLLREGKTMGAGFVGDIDTLAQGTMSRLGSLGSALGSWIGATEKSFQSGASHMVTSVVSTFSSSVGSIKSALEKGFSGALDFLGSLPSTFEHKATSIMGSFAKGIKDHAGEIKTALQNAVTSAASAAGNWLSQHNPLSMLGGIGNFFGTHGGGAWNGNPASLGSAFGVPGQFFNSGVESGNLDMYAALGIPFSGSLQDWDFSSSPKPVYLPGGKSAQYQFLRSYTQAGMGTADFFNTPNGGVVQTNHMQGAAPFAPGQTVSGGTYIGMSGEPTDPKFGSGYHLCIVTDSLGRQYLAAITPGQFNAAAAAGRGIAHGGGAAPVLFGGGQVSPYNTAQWNRNFFSDGANQFWPNIIPPWAGSGSTQDFYGKNTFRYFQPGTKELSALSTVPGAAGDYNQYLNRVGTLSPDLVGYMGAQAQGFRQQILAVQQSYTPKFATDQAKIAADQAKVSSDNADYQQKQRDIIKKYQESVQNSRANAGIAEQTLQDKYGIRVGVMDATRAVQQITAAQRFSLSMTRLKEEQRYHTAGTKGVPGAKAPAQSQQDIAYFMAHPDQLKQYLIENPGAARTLLNLNPVQMESIRNHTGDWESLLSASSLKSLLAKGTKGTKGTTTGGLSYAQREALAKAGYDISQTSAADILGIKRSSLDASTALSIKTLLEKEAQKEKVYKQTEKDKESALYRAYYGPDGKLAKDKGTIGKDEGKLAKDHQAESQAMDKLNKSLKNAELPSSIFNTVSGAINTAVSKTQAALSYDFLTGKGNPQKSLAAAVAAANAQEKVATAADLASEQIGLATGKLSDFTSGLSNMQSHLMDALVRGELGGKVSQSNIAQQAQITLQQRNAQLLQMVNQGLVDLASGSFKNLQSTLSTLGTSLQDNMLQKLMRGGQMSEKDMASMEQLIGYQQRLSQSLDGFNAVLSSATGSLSDMSGAASTLQSDMTGNWEKSVIAGAGAMNGNTAAMLRSIEASKAVTTAQQNEAMVIAELSGDVAGITSGLSSAMTLATSNFQYLTVIANRTGDAFARPAGTITQLTDQLLVAAGNLGTFSDALAGAQNVVSLIKEQAQTEFLRTGGISQQTYDAYYKSSGVAGMLSADQIGSQMLLDRNPNNINQSSVTAYLSDLGNEMTYLQNKQQDLMASGQTGTDQYAKLTALIPQVQAEQEGLNLYLQAGGDMTKIDPSKTAEVTAALAEFRASGLDPAQQAMTLFTGTISATADAQKTLTANSKTAAAQVKDLGTEVAQTATSLQGLNTYLIGLAKTLASGLKPQTMNVTAQVVNVGPGKIAESGNPLSKSGLNPFGNPLTTPGFSSSGSNLQMAGFALADVNKPVQGVRVIGPDGTWIVIPASSVGGGFTKPDVLSYLNGNPHVNGVNLPDEINTKILAAGVTTGDTISKALLAASQAAASALIAAGMTAAEDEKKIAFQAGTDLSGTVAGVLQGVFGKTSGSYSATTTPNGVTSQGAGYTLPPDATTPPDATPPDYSLPFAAPDVGIGGPSPTSTAQPGNADTGGASGTSNPSWSVQDLVTMSTINKNLLDASALLSYQGKPGFNVSGTPDQNAKNLLQAAGMGALSNAQLTGAAGYFVNQAQKSASSLQDQMLAALSSSASTTGNVAGNAIATALNPPVQQFANAVQVFVGAARDKGVTTMSNPNALGTPADVAYATYQYTHGGDRSAYTIPEAIRSLNGQVISVTQYTNDWLNLRSKQLNDFFTQGVGMDSKGMPFNNITDATVLGYGATLDPTTSMFIPGKMGLSSAQDDYNARVQAGVFSISAGFPIFPKSGLQPGMAYPGWSALMLANIPGAGAAFGLDGVGPQFGNTNAGFNIGLGAYAATTPAITLTNTTNNLLTTQNTILTQIATNTRQMVDDDTQQQMLGFLRELTQLTREDNGSRVIGQQSDWSQFYNQLGINSIAVGSQ